MITSIHKVEKVNRQICKPDGSSNPKCNDGVCAVEGINELNDIHHIGFVCNARASRHPNGWQLRYPNHEYVKSGSCGYHRIYNSKSEAVEALVNVFNEGVYA